MTTQHGENIERLVRLEVLMDETRKAIDRGFAEMKTELGEVKKEVRQEIASLDKRVQANEDAILSAKVTGKTVWAVGAVLIAIASAIGALVAKLLPLVSH